MPHAYWRRNLKPLKRLSRSKPHRRFSASVDLLRSWRAKSRAAVVRVRCLPYCGIFPRRPLTLTLSPDGGEGISRASSLLVIAIRSLRSRFFCEQRVYSISHRRIHLDQRRPETFAAFAQKFFRCINAEFAAEGLIVSFADSAFGLPLPIGGEG